MTGFKKGRTSTFNKSGKNWRFKGNFLPHCGIDLDWINERERERERERESERERRKDGEGEGGID